MLGARPVNGPKFDRIESDFHEGLAPFRIGDKWGFTNTAGRIVVEPNFDSARDFSEGLGRVAIRNKAHILEWGFVNRCGEIIIQPQFEVAGNFSEGLAWVRPFGGKAGYIDPGGRLVIKPQFDAATNFLGGLAQVVVIGDKKSVDPHGVKNSTPKYGYIDKTGKFVWKLLIKGSDSPRAQDNNRIQRSAGSEFRIVQPVPLPAPADAYVMRLCDAMRAV